MTGAEVNIARGVDGTGPDVGLLGIENLVQTRRQRDHSIVSYRNAARFAFEQLGARAYLPNSRLAANGYQTNTQRD